ncbi:hypothetical protein AWB76_03267 [Caballeronia temeraria]|uniref:Uncharacterized protein n=1 Tax=Caballeronia temeraria TaxID=1777137 RepID=A0A158AXJ7_9BURK|nr:hypothetical protein [Caballeronia temeraria]SAK62552.1 hypothetical protein AWB76_03267 [Caballeronia temeraria]
MQTDEIDDLLVDWYGWSSTYQGVAGYARTDATCRGFRISRQWDDLSDTVDAQLRESVGKIVEPIVERLDIRLRIAVNTAVRNFRAGRTVFRNPRYPETQDADYAKAKQVMRPQLAARNLVRGLVNPEKIS